MSVVRARAEGPAGLVFVILREAYDPLWQARVAHISHRPLSPDGLWNGYPILIAGPTTTTLEYVAAPWYDAGIGISAASLAALAPWPAGCSPAGDGTREGFTTQHTSASSRRAMKTHPPASDH